jgi:hypothetical protein
MSTCRRGCRALRRCSVSDDKAKEALRSTLSEAISSWPNHPWLVLPGPVDLGPALATHIAEHLTSNTSLAIIDPTTVEPDDEDDGQVYFDDYAVKVDTTGREPRAYRTRPGGSKAREVTADALRQIAAEYLAAAFVLEGGHYYSAVPQGMHVVEDLDGERLVPDGDS